MLFVDPPERMIETKENKKDSNGKILFYILLCAVIGYSISYMCIKAFDNHEKEIELLKIQKENLKLELKIKQLEIKKLNCT